MLSKTQIRETLAATDLFKPLDDKGLEHLAAVAKYNFTPRGSFLLLERQQGHELFLIVSGQIDIEITLPGAAGTKTITTMRPGDLVGELALVDIPRRSASARAVDDLVTLAWTKEEILRPLEQAPEMGYQFMRNLARLLAKRLMMTNKELGNAVYQVVYNVETQNR